MNSETICLSDRLNEIEKDTIYPSSFEFNCILKTSYLIGHLAYKDIIFGVITHPYVLNECNLSPHRSIFSHTQ